MNQPDSLVIQRTLSHAAIFDRFVRLRKQTVVAASLMCASILLAQGTGTIEGRISSAVNGAYLETAQVTVEGTALEAFTDSDGNFRLNRVPAGTARVKAFFTGLLPQTKDVVVTAGQTVRHDVQLASFQKAPADTEGIVHLDEFVVATSREMSATAYAINEQRFAPNIKNVVSTDEFGNVAEGNMGEFLKFLPGLQINYDSGMANTVSIAGAPADNVPVTLDGFDIASSGSAGGSVARSVDLTLVSVSNISRVEVAYTPTPDSRGSALAGSVNFVPRSSFERVHPIFNYSVALLMRDDRISLSKTPGPYRNPGRKIYPGLDFSYIVPVNKRFGFTVSGGTSKQFSAEPISDMAWRGVEVATNGGAFPHTTPDKPYLSSYRVRDGGRENHRHSFATSLDWKVTAYDRLSFGFQTSFTSFQSTIHTITFNPNNIPAGNFTLAYSHGAPGAGSMDLGSFCRDMVSAVYMPALRWRHDGLTWKIEAGVAHSQARTHERDRDKGFFQSATARRSNVTINFDDIFYLRPGRITVTDTAGQPVNPFDISTYSLISGSSVQTDSVDIKRNAFANAVRNFSWKVPFSVKTGLDLQQGIRDLRDDRPTWSYLGADGRANTADDNMVQFQNESWLSERGTPWGLPKVPPTDAWGIYDAYAAHPNYFTSWDNSRANENTRYRNNTTRSKHSEEVVSAAYVRGDLSLLDRRLKIIGGLRAEQTNIRGEGPLTDPTRNILRNASGAPILNASGQTQPITNDALEASMLTLLDRGAVTKKEYLRWFPSINASYGFRENLIGRVGYYHSVGRPSLNQYTAGLTLPNLELPNASNNRISVPNSGIKAWSARSVQARLEYYFEGVGQISVGGYRREIKNFFGNITTRATPAFLALYSLDPDEYGEYDVVTQRNLDGSVVMTGVDVNYKQALTFLPHWARGVQIFANGTAQRATGEAADNFSGYVPRTASWGFSFTREKFNVRTNWNYRGKNRRGLVAAGASIEPSTYNYGAKYLFVDILGEYRFAKRTSFYFNLRNFTDSPEDFKIYGPNTPAVARFNSRIDYAALWTFGIRGSF
jgi:TonB-dependent receptor